MPLIFSNYSKTSLEHRLSVGYFKKKCRKDLEPWLMASEDSNNKN